MSKESIYCKFGPVEVDGTGIVGVTAAVVVVALIFLPSSGYLLGLSSYHSCFEGGHGHVTRYEKNHPHP